MGFYITDLKGKNSNYLGSRTIYSCADAGAFDAPVDSKWEEYLSDNPNVVGVVDEKGIQACLDILTSGKCKGRDVQKLEQCIREHYMGGFILTY